MRINITLLLLLCCSLYSAAQSKWTIDAIEKVRNGDVEQGMSDLLLAMRANDIVAQFFFAQCYEYGRYVEKDVTQAFFLYRKTAERGLAEGMYNLSRCYNQGIGIKEDHDKASIWMQRFKSKGVKLLLPDFIDIYDSAISYATYPKDKSQDDVATVQSVPYIQTDSFATNCRKSDVDMNIPVTTNNNEYTFAIIIANENYQEVAKVSNALNDGEVFAEYCKKTLGLPNSNVHLVKDATLNNIKREVNLMKQICEAYKGDVCFMFYYAGHGIPDEQSKDAFLLPVDGYGSDVSTGYSLKELYSTLGQLSAKQVVVFIDACFSGSLRGNGMLATARGVAIKAKQSKPVGNMVVLSAAQGDETAWPYKEEGHGLFTYYILKILQETKGDITLGDFTQYIQEQVSRKSIVINEKSQTPCVSVSPTLGDEWKGWTLK